jgi:hypothetical protein
LTDFRALCAELIHLNEVEVDDWTRKWADAVKRTKAALAQPEPQWPPKNCWLDDEPDLCPSHCVFDDPSEVINDCLFAREVKCKTDCKYYRTTLAQPEPQGPTDEELLRLAREWNSGFESIELHFAADYARAVLARWGRPATTEEQQ